MFSEIRRCITGPVVPDVHKDLLELLDAKGIMSL